MASQWTDKDLQLEEYTSLGGQCLSMHPIAAKWTGIRESDNVMKFVFDKGLVISPVDPMDFAQDLPVILERYFHIKVITKARNAPSVVSQQTIGCLIAEPYHQEAFFRNFGQKSSDSMTLELAKSFNCSNKQDPTVVIRRNPSSRFDHRDYFDVN